MLDYLYLVIGYRYICPWTFCLLAYFHIVKSIQILYRTMDWIIQSSFSMQSYGKQLSLFYDQYQSFIPPNPNVHKWKQICEYTQADTLLEWGPNEHFLEYQILQQKKTLSLIHPTQSHSIPPNPTIDVLMLKLIGFIFGTETMMSQKNCQGWMVGVWDGNVGTHPTPIPLQSHQDL